MKIVSKKMNEIKADTVIAFMDETKEQSELFKYLDELSDNSLSNQVIDLKAFNGSFQETFKYAINENLMLILVGLGKKEKLTRQKFSQCIATAARTAKRNVKNKTLAFELIEASSAFNIESSAKVTVPAVGIGLYEFNKYLKEKSKIETLEFIVKKDTKESDKGLEIGAAIFKAMNFTKDLVNEPAQVATPEYIANLASQIAKENKLKAKILNKKEIEELKMNAFLAVGQGSIHEPKFVHLTYKPKGTPRKKVALIGKGITFDAGGMNIKPAASMLSMKNDMTGAASALGIIQAIATLKSDIELHVITALCENMTSGKAYKQGDILTAMNGKTIEVDNTDAEGRITLADALCYADTLKVDEVIDIATLTGAIIAALGHNITGVMGNDQKQIDKFMETSKLSCENTWQLPILDELKDNLKSEVATLKNTAGRSAGASTAAWFLSNFTKSKSWLHIDIAGTASPEKSNKETLFGPTAVMVRTLINYLLS